MKVYFGKLIFWKSNIQFEEYILGFSLATVSSYNGLVCLSAWSGAVTNGICQKVTFDWNMCMHEVCASVPAKKI